MWELIVGFRLQQHTKLYTQTVQGLADDAQNSRIMLAWQHPTLHWLTL